MSSDGRLEIGQTFARYQVLRVLGEGGMGVVYEVMHPGLKKRFALKTLLPSIAAMPEARARFLREGEAASRTSHPNVVAVIDVGSEGEMPYLVMEFLEGQTLADLVGQRGRLPVSEAVDVLLPVLSAVAAGHDQGVVHRDLKPPNIFLARGPWGEPIPKVLDFGVSKLIGQGPVPGDAVALTGTLTVLGTASYMSPEQARGAKQIDGRSDQYALGLILYEMLTGRRAHPGDHPFEVLHNIASGNFILPRQHVADLPIPIERIIVRMLSLDAAARYPTLRDVGRALLPFASQKVRATCADAFAEVPGQPGSGRFAATATLPVSGAAPAPVPPSYGATRPFPASERPAEPSTFGNAAAELNRDQLAVTRPRGRRALIGGGLGVALAGGLIWVIAGRSPVRTPDRSSDGTPAGALDRTTATEPRPASSDPAPATAPAAAVPAIKIASVPTGAVAGQPVRVEKPPAPRTRTIEVRALPAEAEIALDGRPAGRGHLRVELASDDTSSHTLRVAAAGHLTKEISFGPDTTPPAEIVLEAAPPASIAKHVSRSGAHHLPAEHSSVSAAAPPAAPAEVTPPRVAPRETTETPKRGVNNALIIQ